MRGSGAFETCEAVHSSFLKASNATLECIESLIEIPAFDPCQKDIYSPQICAQRVFKTGDLRGYPREARLSGLL
jgi:hypothetical protein